MDPDICPECSADLRAGEIPQEYLLKGYYGPWQEGDPPQYYSRRVGIEIPGVYDGVLLWACPDCGHRWHRWEDKEMRAKAQRYIDDPLDFGPYVSPRA